MYIQNRFPHRALGKMTLEEAFIGKKPDVRHFKIFRSIAYCHVPDDKHTKLDHTVEKGYFVGYSETSKAYRIYIPGKGRIIDVQGFVGAPRVSTREHRQPNRYKSLVTEVLHKEPSSYQEVAQHQVWQDAMVEEYNSIMLNDVWEVVLRPMDKAIVGPQWIYKIKYVADGNVDKYKARFMAKGYAQKEGIEYEDTFASVARYTSIKAVIS
eukprot:PITA_32176